MKRRTGPRHNIPAHMPEMTRRAEQILSVFGGPPEAEQCPECGERGPADDWVQNPGSYGLICSKCAARIEEMRGREGVAREARPLAKVERRETLFPKKEAS